MALVIVTGVHISGKAAASVADELAFAAALLFLAACGLSHWAISKSDLRFERLADKVFATGLVLLTCGVLSFWF